jgi:hypothetical protein
MGNFDGSGGHKKLIMKCRSDAWVCVSTSIPTHAISFIVAVLEQVWKNSIHFAIGQREDFAVL